MHRTSRKLLGVTGVAPVCPDTLATGFPLLTPGEVAGTLRLARQTLARWRVEGVGPAFVKIGGRVAYGRADVEAWLAGRRVTSTSQPLAGA